MAESKSLPDAPQPESRPYHQLNRSVTVLNRVLQIFCGPMTQMSRRKGEQPTENHKSARQSHSVPLSLRSFTCKPIFRLARSYFFLFQHVCVGRIACSEDFRLGNPGGHRIEGVVGVLIFQLLALESLFLRCDQRKWRCFPVWTPEKRISL